MQTDWKPEHKVIVPKQTIKLRKLQGKQKLINTTPTSMENKYPEGSTVSANANPMHLLIVRRYAKRIYYCSDPANPSGKDQVYYERELTQSSVDLEKAK